MSYQINLNEVDADGAIRGSDCPNGPFDTRLPAAKVLTAVKETEFIVS